ncbi:ATP-binding protein [Massilia kyonggiensis]|nr:ATP-binding protein [Massilia kyonggiensis]
MDDVEWPYAGGDIAALIRTRDWRGTPLGPVSGWPERLRGLVDVLLENPVPTALLWGPDGILLYNDGYAVVCGKRHPAVLGGTLHDAWPEAWDFNGRMLANCLAGNHETHKNVSFLLERDGGPRESWFDLYYGPVRGAGGAVVAVLATVIEITDQVEAEQARAVQRRQLDRATSRYQALTAATSDVIYSMSADWSEMRPVDGRGFIKDLSAPVRTWLQDYVPPDEQPRVRAAFEKAIATRSVYELEQRVLRVDGSIGWTLSRAVPIVGEDGEVEEWFGVASDITERKMAEEKLKESDRRKDEFLAMLAHELRNPLAPIGTAAALLQTGRLDADRVRATSQIIGRQVGHMTELIDDLLDVSRVTRGLITLERTALDVKDIVRDAVEQVAPLVAARGHTLALDLAPGATFVLGDRKRLVQVVSNILNNAAKYTREGGTIRVTATADDAHVTVSVADDGVGMTPEFAAHAFELFAQAERTSDRSTGGLGLGLALVKSLVELHGGTVSCASPGPGRGSTFRVSLPRLAGEAAAPSDPQAVPAAEALRARRILVVDDNTDAADMLSMLLEAAGHRVSVEHEPQRALERARAERPQVCLIDIGLPDMDGNMLAQRLRADPATAGALLVATTGYGQASDRRRSLAAGFDHHLVKPLDLQELYAILDASIPG